METRTKILNAAERFARATGYEGFSFADVAEAVGIRKASIHHHFPTKSDLAAALLKRYSEAFYLQLDAIAQNNARASDQLAAFISAYRVALAGGERVCLCVSFSASRDSLEAPAVKILNSFHRSVAKWLSQRFELALRDKSVAGVKDPADEANALLALLEGAQLVARAARKPACFDKSVALFAARLKQKNAAAAS